MGEWVNGVGFRTGVNDEGAYPRPILNAIFHDARNAAVAGGATVAMRTTKSLRRIEKCTF